MFSCDSNLQDYTSASYCNKKKHDHQRRLPDAFAPGQFSVLCGRGSKCTKSAGNQNLKGLVLGYLKAYSEAINKVQKTSIVSAIIQSVKEQAPDGAFIKYEDGAWWEVDDAFAREKIGCLFRDCLFTQYRSSTKAKLARKKATNVNEIMSSTNETKKEFLMTARKSHGNTASFHRDVLRTLPQASLISKSTTEPIFVTSQGSELEKRKNNCAFTFQLSGDTLSNDNNSVTHTLGLQQQFLPQNIDALSSLSNKAIKTQNTCVAQGVSGFGETFYDLPRRQDFVQECINPQYTLIASEHTRAAMLNDIFPAGPHCSLLRQACNIIDDCPGGIPTPMDGYDFPDDISDIFES